MSDLQGNEAPVPGVFAGIEEAQQVLPGALLAAQRQARGWSVEHAASQLKFATRQVLALEADNYAALPGPVIVRGFVRAYAKLLGMDANELVAALPNQGVVPGDRIIAQRTLSTPFSESPLPLGNRKKLSPLWFVGGAVVVALVVAAGVVLHNTDLLDRVPQLAWLKHGDKPVVTLEEPAAQAPAEQADLPPEVQDGSDHGKQDKTDVVASDSAAAGVNVATTAVSEPPAASASVPAAPSAPVAVAPGTTSAAASAAPVTDSLNISNSKDLLRLNFREDSWVEIRRADNSIMISRLLKAGTTESFDITGPVTLVVGNVAGVDASLRGAKLDLQTGNNNNVARLSLK